MKHHDIDKYVNHLRTWSRFRKMKQVYSTNWWACGKWMTSIEPEVVKALVDGGFAKRDGAYLVMIKPEGFKLPKRQRLET